MTKQEPPHIPPGRLAKDKAERLLRDQLEEIKELRKQRYSSDQFDKWLEKTNAIIRAIYGEPSPQFGRFSRISYSPMVLTPNTPDSTWQKCYLDGLDSAVAVLDAFLFEVTTLCEPEREAPKNVLVIPQTPSFPFVRHSRLRSIIERDYAELQRLRRTDATKAELIAVGSLIEAFLLDALVAAGKWTFEEGKSRFLSDMIGPAITLGIISEDKLTHALRRYRALVHSAREIRESIVFDESDAKLALAALEVIIREVKSWHEKQPS